MKLLNKVMCIQMLIAGGLYFFVVMVSWANETTPKKLTASIVENSPEGKLTLGLVEEMCKRLGIVLQMRSLPIARAIDELDQENIDIEGPRNHTVEKIFSNIIRVPETLFVNDLIAFSKDPNIKISGWNSLKRFRVAYVRGWKIYKNNVVGVKHLDIIESDEALFKFLDAGRTDVALSARILGSKVISDLKLKGIVAIEPPLVVKKMYFYMNKKYEKLTQVMAETLRGMKRDGTYQRLYNKTLNSIVQ